MTKFVDSLGLKRLVTKIGEKISQGYWLPLISGSGDLSVEMSECTASGSYSFAEGESTTAEGTADHAEGSYTTASGYNSHAEGSNTTSKGFGSHAEGGYTTVSGVYAHAQGSYNYDDPSFIDMVGVGNYNLDEDPIRKNASVIYVGRDEGTEEVDPSNPKNGYQYLLGVGGYQGQAIDDGMKSVQEVIADLEKGVAATETMTVEDIREIMSA